MASNSIVLNAGGDKVTSSTDGFFVSPVRSFGTGAANLGYNPTTKEIFVASSSRRYKTDIQDIKVSESARVWDLRPVLYRSLDKAEEGPKSYGFIAEEVAQVDSRLCFWSQDAEGLPQVEGVNYDQVIPLLLQETKELKAARETDATHIQALKAARETDAIRIEALEKKMETLIVELKQLVEGPAR